MPSPLPSQNGGRGGLASSPLKMALGRLLLPQSCLATWRVGSVTTYGFVSFPVLNP